MTTNGRVAACGALRHRSVRLMQALLATSAIIVAGPSFVLAQSHPAATAATRLFAIPPQSLDGALAAFSRTSGVQVLNRGGVTQGVTSPGVSGTYTPREALSRLLSGTGLNPRFVGANTVTVSGTGAAQTAAGAAPAGAISLDTIDVQGGSAATDGTGSYTSDYVTIAGKLPVNVREVPNSVSVVTQQRITDQNLVTVQDAMRQVTGVTTGTYSGIGDAHYTARGQALGVQFDGIPASAALPGFVQFDLPMYDRVEVIRGPAGLFQGSADFGGIVNLARKRPRDTFGISGGVEYGSWNNKHADIDITGPLTSSGAVRGRLVLSGTDRNFAYPTAFQQRWLGYGIIEADLTPNTTLTLSGSYQYDKATPSYGVGIFSDGTLLDPTIGRKIFAGADWARWGGPMKEGYVDLRHKFDNGWTAAATFLHRDLEPSGSQIYSFGTIDPTTYLTNFATQKMNQRYDWNLADTYIGGPVEIFGRTHQFVVGANYAFYGNTIDSSPFTSIPDVNILNPRPINPNLSITSGNASRQVQYGIYGQARLKLLDPLTLVLGGRLSSFESETRDVWPIPTNWTTGSKADGKFTPYGGVVFDVNRNISLYASYADIFRPQSLKAFGGGFLPPQEGNQIEAGIKGQFLNGKLNTSLAIFRLRDTNRPLLDLSHPSDTPLYTAAGEAESRGFEAEISGSITESWKIFAGYAFTTTEYISDPDNAGKPLDPRFPEHNFKLWTDYTFLDGTLNGLNIGGGVRAVSATNSGTAPLIRQSAYAVVDAQIGYQFTKNVKGTLTVYNLFDQKYLDRVGFQNWFNWYGAPRSVTVALRATF